MKKNFYLFLIPIFLLLFIATEVKATHVMGGNITYKCLGGDTLEITLAAYKDCKGAANLPGSASIRIEGCGSFQFVTADTIGVLSNTDITPVCPFFQSTPCNQIPGQPILVPTGTLQYIYRVTIILSQLNAPLNTCSDLTFSWSTCCRNGAITTTVNPQGDGNYFYATYKKSSGCNNSPQFLNDPVPFLCGGDQFNFNHGAYDPDGDSLSFSLVACKDNATTDVTYKPGFSATNPVSSAGGVTIDPITGTISFLPIGGEFALICVKIDEFRNGVKIGEYYRDLQFVILDPSNCSNPAPSLSGMNGRPVYDTTICPGQTLCFDVYSQDINPFQGINLKWNESLPGATFTVVKTGGVYKGTLCWTPPTNLEGIFHLSISAQDDGCPLVATTSKGYVVEVFQPLINAGRDTSICPGGNAVQMSLAARVNFNSFNWNPAIGISDPTIANPLANPPVTTTYTVTATNGYCTATDTITIFKETNPPLTVSNDTIACPGDSIPLVASSVSNAKYRWSPRFGLSPSDTLSTVYAKPSGTITYTVRATSPAGCRSYDSVTVTLVTPATLSAGTNTAVCNGSSIELAASSPQTVTYDWEPKNSIVGPSNIANPEVNPTNSTWYKVAVTDDQGCVTRDSVYVIVNPLPSVDAGPTVTIPEGGSATLNASPTGNYTYEWNPGAATDPTFVVSPTEDQTYTLTVTDFNGCVGEDTVSVLVYIAKLVMPNAFSPNGDNINDRFGFVELGPLEVEFFRIYNRWGTLIYECTGMCPGWDGTYKGEPQPAGSYSFVIQSRPVVGDPEFFKGNFTLVR